MSLISIWSYKRKFYIQYSTCYSATHDQTVRKLPFCAQVTTLDTIQNKVKRKQLRWITLINYLIRSPKTSFEGTVEGQQLQLKPRKRWIDNIGYVLPYYPERHLTELNKKKQFF